MAERIVVQAQFEAVVDSFKAEMLATRKRIEDVNRGIGRTNRQLRGFQDRLNRAGRSLRTFAVGFVGYGLVNNVRQLGQEFLTTADTFRLAQDRIALFTRELGNSNEINQELFEISQRTRSALIPNVNAFARLAVAVGVTKDNYQDLLSVVEAVNLTGALSGTGIQERTAVLTQLLQALGSNRLGGEELRAILEQDPRLTGILRDIAGQFDKSVKDFAEEGGFTTELLVKGIVNELNTLRKEFASLPPTIAQVVQQIRNSIGQAALEFDGFFGITDRVVKLLQSFQKALNTEKLIALSLGIIQFRDNLLAIINPLRVLISWINGFKVAVNTLEAALYALPFLGFFRLGAGAVRAAGAARQALGRQARELRKVNKELRGLPRDQRGTQAAKDLRRRARELEFEVGQLGKYEQRIQGIERSVRGGLFGGVGAYGLVQGLRGRNPLTEGLDQLIARQQDLDALLPRVNEYLREQGRIFEFNPTTKIGRVRDLTSGEKQKQLIDAHLEKLRQFREGYLKEYGPALAIVEREKRLLSDRVVAQEDIARLEKLPGRGAGQRRIAELRTAIFQYNQELAALQTELAGVLASEEFQSESLAAFKKAAEDAAAAMAKLTAKIGDLKDATKENPFAFLGAPDTPAFHAALREMVQKFPGLLSTEYEARLQELADRIETENEAINQNLRQQQKQRDKTPGIFPTLQAFNQRRADRDSDEDEAARLRREDRAARASAEIGAMQARMQQQLTVLAQGYNKTLQFTNNLLGQMNRQIAGMVEGTTRWQDALRNTLRQIEQMIGQLAVVEPLARKIASALNPQGANAVRALERLSGGLVGTVTNPRGNINTFTGVFNRVHTTQNFWGTPAMEWGIRRSRSRGAQDVLGILMANPGAYK